MVDKYCVTDAHCHVYPEKIASKAVGGTDNFYGVISACTGTFDNLMKEGKSAGIDRFIVQSVATTPKQVKSINNFICEEVSAYPEILVGLGTLHPDSENQIDEVNHILQLGLKGVKLHPDIQNFKVDDPRCLKIYELCEREHLPILMHTGDSRYDNSNPNRLIPVLKSFPDLIVVGAHFGGYSIWEEASRKLCEFENLFVDCSSSFPFISKELAKELILRYTPDKVLFGTDYPMWTPEKEISTFLSLGFSEKEYAKMFNGNAEKVFIK